LQFKHQKDLKEDESKQVNIHEIKKDVGISIATVSMYEIAVLYALYLLTVYLSTMMLDITFPILTMSVLLTIRLVVTILIGCLCLQIVFGLIYSKKSFNKIVKLFGYMVGIIQLLCFPLGSYAGALLLRDLRYDVKNLKEETEKKDIIEPTLK
jgi:hypothetical protein